MLWPFLAFAAVATLAAVFWLGYVLGRGERRPRVAALPQRYSFVPDEGAFTRATFDDADGLVGVSAGDLANEQPLAFREKMLALGQRFREGGVTSVVFVHGTFVGTDPFSLVHGLRRFIPGLDEPLSQAIGQLTKAQSENLTGDRGNFVRGYAEFFQEAIGGNIPCSSFEWSSENHHVGRIHGAVRLAHTLARLAPKSAFGRRRVLLVGHSHGGQLFALLSQFLASSAGENAESALLFEAARARGEDSDVLKADLERLHRLDLDVVTFGMPPRYGWGDIPNLRLMHVVNHRGVSPRADGLRGLLQTRQGDYVHLFGIAGSDFPAPVASERVLNTKLDGVLGRGGGVGVLLRNLRHGARVPQHGHTFLVDYQDASTRFPNFLATGFGHGVYTRFGAMLFNSRLIADHLYPAKTNAAIEASKIVRLAVAAGPAQWKSLPAVASVVAATAKWSRYAPWRGGSTK